MGGEKMKTQNKSKYQNNSSSRKKELSKVELEEYGELAAILEYDCGLSEKDAERAALEGVLEHSRGLSEKDAEKMALEIILRDGGNTNGNNERYQS